MECAKAFAALEKQGQRPLRTIVFATWDAEEFGIIGSSEWVEAHREALTKNGVAYINLDMASMGLDFNSSASPSLHRVIMDAASSVPQPGQDGKTVLEAWRARGQPDSAVPSFGDLGGGSDHVAFLCHAGVASCSLGGGGSKGTSYHSAYDTLPWYWKTVGTDYLSAQMVARMTAQTVERLAFSETLPLDPVRYATDLKAKLLAISKAAVSKGLTSKTETELASDFGRLVEIASFIESKNLAGVRGEVAPATLNRLLLSADRVWLSEGGLPGRGWFKNHYAAPDEDSGYASWILPALRRAVERSDAEEFKRAVTDLEAKAEALFFTLSGGNAQP
jgi:N-acetylated-alpha-linked acidic dipeptidase